MPQVAVVERGTPFFKDIPVIGHFFRTTSTVDVQSQLVVAVQSSIERTRDELLADTIRRRIGFERSLTRTQGLDPARDGPVALLLATLDSRAEADATAESLRTDGREVHVVTWRAWDDERHDVLLTGFSSVVEAAEAARPLAAEGWAAQIVVVPGAEPQPWYLHARPNEPPTAPF
jgi:hypothetical protein